MTSSGFVNSGRQAVCCTIIILGALFVSLFDTETYFGYVQQQSQSDRPSFHIKGNYTNNTFLDGAPCIVIAEDTEDDDEIGKTNTTTKNAISIKEQEASSSEAMPFQSFNQTNPHSESWCPYATCHNSPLCAPCQRRYLFLVATARSGSTTLLKMLNYLPHVRLSGENRNELFLASKLISNLHGNTAKSHILDQDFDRTEGAFLHNAIPPQAMSCPVQDVIRVLNPPPKKVQEGVNVTGNPTIEEYDSDTILGVKTIRLQKGTWGVKQAANFFKYSFPCSRVLVNVRGDIEKQLESMNKTFAHHNSNMEAADVESMNEFLIDLTEELGDDMARLVDMSEWTQDVEILNDVVHWLGFRGCKFHAIVHENVNGFGRDHETKPDIGESCHYGH